MFLRTLRETNLQRWTSANVKFQKISDVKEKIAKEKGWEASQQKLIYSGSSI